MTETQNRDDDRSAATRDERAAWWRAVLGEYPTGVSLLAVQGDGDIHGMVVGTFTAVSQDPPLIAVFVDNDSTTFPRLAQAGGFAISVLGTSHEQFSREVVAKTPGRFERAHLVPGASGHPHLADAVAWFDVVIERVEPLGDHSLVLAKVTDFDVGSAGSDLPLLFRRAGYGSFAAPSRPYDMRAFMERLGLVAQASSELQSVADDLGASLTVNTQIGDSVVTVGIFAPAGDSADQAKIGRSFPFAAPVAPVFAAWASAEREHAWTEACRHLLGRVDRVQIQKQLDGVRERGYGVVARRTDGAPFDSLFAGSATRAALAQTWEEILALGSHLDEDPGLLWRRVSGVQVPVFQDDGDVVLALFASALPALADAAALDAVVQRLRGAADAVTRSRAVAG